MAVDPLDLAAALADALEAPLPGIGLPAHLWLLGSGSHHDAAELVTYLFAGSGRSCRAIGSDGHAQLPGLIGPADTVVLVGPDGFDGAGLAAFLDEQADLGTKWAPRYVRVTAALPATSTNKVLKRRLRTEGWDVDDPVWWREGRRGTYALMTADEAEALRARFAER